MSNSYVDDIKVKISEKYKPPCKISIPMSYSQRLTLNKQMQDSRPNYDFHLEKYVLETMKERRDFKNNLAEERKERLDLARKQFDEKIQREKLEELEKEQAQTKLLEEAITAETNPENQTHSTYPNTINADHNQQNYSSNSTSQNQQNYITKNGILMPIPVSSYSANCGNILKPITMSNQTFEPAKQIKPFNLSDFESDTSSPFDNMELKSINDLEELAQVLKSDRTNYQPNMEYFQSTNTYQDPVNYNNATKNYSQLPSNTKSYSNFSQAMTQPSRGYEQNVNDSMAYHTNSAVSQNSVNYNQIPNSYSQINTNFSPISTTFSQYSTPYRPQNTVSYNPSTISNYSNLNGYYYNTPQPVSQMQVAPTQSSYTPYVSSVTQQPIMQRTSCKSVPDLVKSVETELDSTHLNDTSIISGRGQERNKNPFYTTTNVPIPIRPKSTDAVYPKTKVKDEMFNPFDRLSREQKEICRNVSVMGFPLDRVARVCLVFGSDQKKIVDHLLALSELLDLGFSEKSASQALEKTDNDRDKALDVLIS